MKFKRKLIVLSVSLSAMILSCFALFSQKNFDIITNGENCSHSHVEHYAGIKPTESSKGRIEHWACCDCHRAFYDKDLIKYIPDTELDRTVIDINKKTVHSWYGKENVKNDEIINISTDVGDVVCLEQTDWNAYPTGIGGGTFYYYLSDQHPSVYIDAEEMSWSPSHVTARDKNNGGYSTFKFKSNLQSLSKISFDYKFWDISYEPDKNGNHVSLSSSNNSSQKIGINLIPDNNWHSFLLELPNSIQATKIVFDIYHFIGQLYISNLHYNSYEIDSGTAYDISIDSSWANKHVPQFGLPKNAITSSTSLIPLAESALKMVRDGTAVDAGTLNAPLIVKDNEDQYSVDSWWLLNKTKFEEIKDGDLLLIEGTFLASCGENTYYLNIEKTEIIFASTETIKFAHYVNHTGDVLSDLKTSTKTTYRWFMTSSSVLNAPLGSSYKPTSSRNFVINGVNIANLSANGLYQSATDRGEICVLDTDQGFSPLKIAGAKLVIEGLFVNSEDPNNYIYISKTTFYYDGLVISRIYNDIDTSDFHIGTWNGNHHFTNDDALNKVAEAGYDNLIAVNPIWNPNFNHTMSLANELGVQFYCDPRTWDYEHSCYKDWDGSKPAWIDNNAVAGLIVMDEPSILGFETAKNYQSMFNKNIGGDKKMFVNLLNSCVSETSLYGSEDYSTNENYYKDYALKFTETFDANVYGFDSYGLMDNGTMRKTFYCDLDIWSHLAKQNNKELWFTVLSSAHTSGDGYRYATPTLSSMRWKTNLGMAFGVKNLIHYILATSDTSYDAIMDDDGNIRNQGLYNIVKTTNLEAKSWDEIYSQYTWDSYSVYDKGTDNKMFQFLRYKNSLADIGISSISSSENLIVSSFKDSADQNAYMIINAGRSTYGKYANRNKYLDNTNFSMKEGNATIKFDRSYSKAIIIKNGVKTLVNVGGNSLNISYSEYDGMFVIPF